MDIQFKGKEKLEKLVTAEEKLHDKQINALFSFFGKNRHILCKKIRTNGTAYFTPPDRVLPIDAYEASFYGSKYYRYPGIQILRRVLKKSSVPGHAEEIEGIYYIPKTKNIIGVKSSYKIQENTACLKFYDMRKMTKQGLKPYFKFYKQVSPLLGYDSRRIKSIKYSAYRFKGN